MTRPLLPPDIPLDQLLRCIDMANRLPEKLILGWLLCMASYTAHSQPDLLKELQRMALNDDQLTDVVQDLLGTYNDMTTAIQAEVDALKQKGLAAVDPAISSGVTAIEGLVAAMKQATSDAKAAIAPPPATDPAPPPPATVPDPAAAASEPTSEPKPDPASEPAAA